MAWKVTADPERFDEAVKWFRSKVVVTKEAFDTLSDDAKVFAFTVSGTEQLNAVQAVYDAIDKAIEKGESIDTFRARVAQRLGKDFASAQSEHLTTVFRTNVQTAYSTGRYYQLDSPDVTGVLGFRMLDIVLDGRTSDICLALGNPPTILPHDDAYWLSHWPPFHHRCRTCVRALSAAEAGRRGVTKEKPKADIPKGFGLAPPKREEFQPAEGSYDKKLFTEFKKKQATERRKRKKAEKD